MSVFLDLDRHWSTPLLRLTRRCDDSGRHSMSDGHRENPGESLSKGAWPYIWLILVVATCVACLPGCLLPSQESLKKSSWPVQGTSVPEPETKLSQQTLVKPVIPPETSSKIELEDTLASTPQEDAPQKSAPEKRPAPPAAAAPSGAPAGAQPTDAKPEPETKPRTKQWEDEKIKTVALNLAATSAAVVRIKVCYYVKHDEWWVIAYEDTGGPIELKQYIWNRDQEKLEPFLVLKTIARDRLEEHVKASEPDKACEVIPLPPKESKPPERAGGA